MTDLQKEFYPYGLIVFLRDWQSTTNNPIRKGEIFALYQRRPSQTQHSKYLKLIVIDAYCPGSKRKTSVFTSQKDDLWEYV